MKGKVKKILTCTAVGTTTLVATGMTAFASGGEGDFNFISSAINTATSGLKSEAAIVIGSAVGLGMVFWGAKLLWGKFRSMAK